MRKLWPLLILLLPGCTFFSFGNNGVIPRTTAEMKEVSPGLYIVLAIFVFILLLSVAAALFKESRPREPFTGPDEKGMAMMLAVFAALVVLLLVG
jgi:hypothetical protein